MLPSVDPGGHTSIRLCYTTLRGPTFGTSSSCLCILALIDYCREERWGDSCPTNLLAQASPSACVPPRTTAMPEARWLSLRLSPLVDCDDASNSTVACVVDCWLCERSSTESVKLQSTSVVPRTHGVLLKRRALCHTREQGLPRLCCMVKYLC